MASVWNRDISELIPALQKKRKIPIHELAVLCRKLSILLDAGVPVKNTLLLLAEQSVRKERRNILYEVHASIQRGDSLSHAFTSALVFPSFLCKLTAVGEMTAQLPAVLAQMADYYEQQSKIQDELKAVMIYPAVVTTMMLAVIILAITFVLPNYGRVFAASGVPLPVITQVLMSFSMFIINQPHVIFTSLLAVVLMVIFFLRSKTGRGLVDTLRLRVPLIRQSINLNFTQSLALLLFSGQPLTTAVPVCANVLGNDKARRDILEHVAAGISEGRAFWETLATIKYIDPLLIGMVRVGEETGRLSQTMEKCRDYFKQAYQQNLQKTSKLIEPMITLALGLLLGLVMLAIILPTYALTDIV
jgi:type IV pilus assembly protein PilC